MQKEETISRRSSRRKRRRINGRSSHPHPRCLALTVMAVILLSTGGYVVYRDYQKLARLEILPDRNAKRGTLHAGEPRQVEDGNFWVVVNQLPTMEAGSRECNIEYENPDSNRYSARVSLSLKESGKLLGKTMRVDPGRYVETMELLEELPPGEYPVTAGIELFHRTDPAGGMSLDITLRVMEKREGETE